MNPDELIRFMMRNNGFDRSTAECVLDEVGAEVDVQQLLEAERAGEVLDPEDLLAFNSAVMPCQEAGSSTTSGP